MLFSEPTFLTFLKMSHLAWIRTEMRRELVILSLTSDGQAREECWQIGRSEGSEPAEVNKCLSGLKIYASGRLTGGNQMSFLHSFSKRVLCPRRISKRLLGMSNGIIYHACHFKFYDVITSIDEATSSRSHSALLMWRHLPE